MKIIAGTLLMLNMIILLYKLGLIDGIKDVDSPIRLSFMPYASVYADMYDGETTFPV